MRKSVVLAVLAALCACPLAAQLSLVADGGWGYAILGDFNRSVDSSNEIIERFGLLREGRFERAHAGLDLGLEARYRLGDRFALGLGVGMFRLAYDFDVSYTLDLVIDQSNSGWVRAVPVTLSGYYVVPLGSWMRLNLTAGVGLYLVSFQWNNSFYYTSSLHYGYTFESSRPAIGVHAGVELEYALGRGWSLIAAVKGRLARASDFKGDWSGSGVIGGVPVDLSGSDWYYYYFEGTFNGVPVVNLAFQEDPPSGATVQRKGVVDLSGVTAAVGLKVSFGGSPGR